MKLLKNRQLSKEEKSPPSKVPGQDPVGNLPYFTYQPYLFERIGEQTRIIRL